MNTFHHEDLTDTESDFWSDESPSAQLTAVAKKTKSAKVEPGGEGILTVDVYQTETDIIIKSTIAGVSDKDLDVSVTNEMVTIKGTRVLEDKVRSGGYIHQELYWGAFSRSIILPEEVDADAAKATLKNGILTLQLPKLSRLKTKRVKVTS